MDTTREEESNFPPDRLFNATTSSSSSSFNSSPPDFLRNVKAAFKRHRMMPQVNLQPRRLVLPRRGTSNSSIVDSKMEESNKQAMQDMSLAEDNNNNNHESAKFMSVDAQRVQSSLSCDCRSNNKVDLSCLKCGHVVDGRKKVQFALENDAISHGSVDQMDIITANLLTHMSSLALTEMEYDVNNQPDASTAPSHDVNEQNNQVNSMRNFLQNDFGHHMTSSSVVGSTCATTTLINSVNAPMFNSTTHISRPTQHGNVHTSNSLDMNYQRVTPVDMGDPPKHSSKVLSDQIPENKCELPRNLEGKEAESCDIPKDHPPFGDKSTVGDITDLKSQPPISNDQVANVKSVTSKSGKNDKPASKKDASAPRKRSYDPDLFFKVNGKLYQRLGKIGSGGSSEVHKVISQDCTIYALKKIKLKGRDYATAYGFCQEIEYLNKLKGKNHIIQLIDYEVTDKALLKEVLSGCMSNKDGRVKEDGCIYMVLEYGEIDLAHMLSHKWKELDNSRSSTIDENWLRLYWQQILLAVKTIHEERIVHSDLKPANFLLVRGSLKLIDFGIAKAIMSDTTNIQRDSQVGTLSYMSPEAFMCNETDSNGNTIKCGRPSDIWSLGCILYQMVYGRTPFADYTTFWTKFKVITDPNHQIHYEPLSNPSLLDLMKQCLSWDRKERWTIPQLLQHPFLVPPIPPPISDHHCNFIKLVADSCIEDPKTTMFCSRLQQLLSDPFQHIKSVGSGLGSGSGSISLEQRRTLLDEISDLCLQLKELPANANCD